MYLKILQYLLIALCVFDVHCGDPEVEIPQGRLRGRKRYNRDGGAFYSFQNIPYAQPPAGKLRFKAPKPAHGWKGIRDATKDLSPCVQIEGQGQEDCLYLNVYIPELPANNVSKKAVMVWIHGGSFIYGSAEEYQYGPEFLLTKDVVFVALNYRLGMFGFFSLDDSSLDVTGNAGLKDQALALRWVKHNIQYFGGDPSNILIFGESAGSMSVHLQILSPMSQGLFAKAIFQSGCVFTDLVVEEVRNNGVILAEALGVQTKNWRKMLKTLQALPTSALAAAEWSLYAVNKFYTSPVIEVASGKPSFIPRNPLDIIRSGNYNQVPFITGFTNAEGLMYESEALRVTGESILIVDFDKWIPPDLQIESGSETEKILGQKIKHFYYGDTEPSRDDISGAVYLTTDHTFGFPAYRSVLEHLKTSLHPIYFYFFSADTKLNFIKKMDNIEFPGAAHADDLGYLFYMPMMTPSDIEDGSVEDLGIRNMVDLWTNFAIYGNPTPPGFNYKWEPVQENRFNYLHIATEGSTMKVDPKPESMKFWSDIFAEYFPK